jgi:hypothetical protein
MDLCIGGLEDSTQRSYKTGWNLFIVYLISTNKLFPDWENKEDCIITFQDFIT